MFLSKLEFTIPIKARLIVGWVVAAASSASRLFDIMPIEPTVILKSSTLFMLCLGVGYIWDPKSVIV